MSDFIFETSTLGFRVRVYPNRVSYKKLMMGEISVPLSQIASVELGMPGLQQVVIETTGGKKYKFVIKLGEKEKFRDAVYDQMN